MSGENTPDKTGSQDPDNPDKKISTPDNEPDNKTLEELDAVKNQVQNQSAVIGKLQREIEKIKKAEPDNKPGEKTKNDSLAERVETLEAREKLQQRNAALLSVREALVTKGINNIDAKNVADYFVYHNKDKIKIDDNFSVKIDEDGTDTDVNKYVDAWLKSDGKVFMPTKTKPNSSGINNRNIDSDVFGGGDYSKIFFATDEELKKL